MSSSIKGKVRLLIYLFSFLGICLMMSAAFNIVLKGISDATANLNEEKLTREMNETGFVLVATKETASYEGECQGDENRIVDNWRLYNKAYVFCRKQ